MGHTHTHTHTLSLSVFLSISSLSCLTMKVQVYLYDLSQGMMASLSPALLGRQLDAIWHTSVVAFGNEYFFGGGIQKAAPGATAAGRPVEVVDLGETEIPQWMFEQYLHGLQDRFNAQTYHLLRNNCNHFSQEAASFLTGNSIPEKVRNLPNEFLSTYVPLVLPLESVLGLSEAFVFVCLCLLALLACFACLFCLLCLLGWLLFAASLLHTGALTHPFIVVVTCVDDASC